MRAETEGDGHEPLSARKRGESDQDIRRRKGSDEPRKRVPRRYHGSVRLDPECLARDAGRIADDIVQHLVVLRGARLEVTLDIAVDIPDVAPEHVVRTVTENGRTLKFTPQGFEER